MWERFGLSVMQRMDPERAHALAIAALRTGALPLKGPVTSPRLATTLAGLALPNPVGLAAGFDKNAEAIAPLSRAGFGFLEVGAATPRAQEGNARPRLFRLTEDAAAINRFGFNNAGMEAIAGRLAAAPRLVPVGLNLGANKDSADRAGDFARVLARCGPHLDFATVNVSSPNTERLRELQGRAALEGLLAGVMAANADLARPVPIFLKIAPDLDDEALAEIAEVAKASGIAGIIATNTTLSRSGLTSRHRDETGGLSGQPLFEKSTRVLAKLHRLTEGAMPLIGVGGVASAAQAWEKLRAGATAVQLYTGLVYGGITLGARIAEKLDAGLVAEGMTVAEVTGTGVDAWL
ncbi:quinone-dependent dihydroorotate dehydrogenase [Roseibacterium sp. SDUM158017]|uniref:quinone-dependent dihydroorotate dehydrogenase n=1 Tax=Roseicyclus salinarum TaxID=3036773 RepID=UPI0024153B0D|nr:quinone-dependent dihydroorotate dehydrogenase [Roseibacterium sp. SDUM158017]MDG4649693.1 quinone-dependent dihydroorotate dehydrogenase [Roseibacterium sp. SDUM158017]